VLVLKISYEEQPPHHIFFWCSSPFALPAQITVCRCRLGLEKPLPAHPHVPPLYAFAPLSRRSRTSDVV
jgi:hypothetical protein